MRMLPFTALAFLLSGCSTIQNSEHPILVVGVIAVVLFILHKAFNRHR